MLEGSVQLFAHRVARDVELDAATRFTQRAVLHGRKAGLAHHALEHHAARHTHADAVGFQHTGLHMAVGGVQVGGLVGWLEVVGKRHASTLGLGFTQSAEFFRRSAMSWLSSWGTRELRRC